MAKTAALAATLASGLARGQTTEIVSVDSSGVQATLDSFFPSISADGRLVAFHSWAQNLVVGDTNSHADVFVRDRLSGTTERVSVGPNGVEGNSGSSAPAISADGRWLAFQSQATNLVVGGSSSTQHIFVRDLLNGTTELISVATNGSEGSGASSGASISADGRFVAFFSQATNLVPGDTNAHADIFVRDRFGATTERVSVATGGGQADLQTGGASISAEGRFVAFSGYATNLVQGDTNGQGDVFVHDRSSGTTERVSVSTSGAEGNADSYAPSISADGRFIAFTTTASNLVWGDTNSRSDVLLRDCLNGTTERVSVATGGGEPNADSQDAKISADARFVAFRTTAANVVAGDTNAALDVFLHDSQSGVTLRVSVATGGAEGNSASYSPSISADGRAVAFISVASNFVPGDSTGYADVFVAERAPLPFSFCSGDGSGAACPCGNGSSGSGCPNSLHVLGASLTASGTASATADSLVLIGGAMSNSSALYFQGTAQLLGGTGAVFGDGLRCVGGSVIRLDTKTNSSGASHYPEAGDPSVSVKGAVAASDVRVYQIWYRNAAVFCTSSTFNLTNGLGVTWSL